jgi:hypothetical protein
LAADRHAQHLPAELIFLSAFGANTSILIGAAIQAQALAITPEAALLSRGAVSETFFYQSLARHLGVAFIDNDIELGDGAVYPRSILVGVAPLGGAAGPRWLTAPRGDTLTSLLRRKQRGESLSGSLAVTTPAHMSRLVRGASAATIARDASFALPDLDASLSAKAGATPAQGRFAIMALSIGVAICVAAPESASTLISVATGCLFLATVSLRLFAGAVSLDRAEVRHWPHVNDRELPTYSIVIGSAPRGAGCRPADRCARRHRLSARQARH